MLGAVLDPIKVSISQFYGIEINDFAATVAKTALWIAESQMMKATEDIVHMNLDFLPLKSYVNIVEGNALRIDWETVVPKAELSYIMGNPPFVGGKIMTAEQKKELTTLIGDIKRASSMDYVVGWYCKAARYIQNTRIEVSFVSTNSIVQGAQIAPLWKSLIQEYGISINYAYRTFKWISESKKTAGVHCVIIGFANFPRTEKWIFTENSRIAAQHINPYLIDGPDIFIENRSRPLCDVPPMYFGNMPNDGGNYVLTPKEKDEFLSAEPEAAPYVREYLGSEELINGKRRYCIWLKGVNPGDIRKLPHVYQRVERVRETRLASSAAPTREKANIPHLFFFISQPETKYIAVPQVSSERRKYIPMGFLSSDVIASNLISIIPSESLYLFGILTSNVHNAWMRVVAGRLETRYRYSGGVVYNNFPWPTPTDTQKVKIEQTAQAILDARALYPDCSLADLYDEITMPPELRKAHQANDKAVMESYGMPVRETTEASCVAELMRRYQELTK